MKTLPVLFLILSCIHANAAIFGRDDRIAIAPGTRGHALSRSTAVAILNSLHEPVGPGKLKLFPNSLEGLLCEEERFSRSISLPYSCSGFLVAPDLIATAGHCMVNTGESRNETDTYCQAYSWLFDYQEGIDTNNVPADNLYRCKQVIYAVKDEEAPFRDYALVQLDRPVSGRRPLKLAPGPLSPREIFSMIGHPHGTPAKLSHGARLLLDNPQRESFITTLDAFEGNSGSAVFNARDEVVGILVAGTPGRGLISPAGRSCEIYNRCDERGENCLSPDKDTSIFPGFQRVGTEVQRIAPVIELINQSARSLR